MTRLFAALALVIAFVAVAPTHAHAVALDAVDAEELREALAQAQEVQSICYSYELSVQDSSGSESTNERGSSWAPAGARTTPTDLPTTCVRHIRLRATVVYTAESSESEDSSNYTVSVLSLPSGVPDHAAQSKIQARATAKAGSLINDPGDAVFNRMSEMPAIAAEAGLGPYLPLETRTEPLAQDAALTGSPGSDFLRTKGMTVLLLTLCILGAAGWATYIVISDRAQKRREQQRASRRKKYRKVVSDEEQTETDDASPVDADDSPKEERT